MNPADGHPADPNPEEPEEAMEVPPNEFTTVFPNGFCLPYPMLQAEAALNRLNHPELYDDKDQVPRIRCRPTTRRRKQDIEMPWLEKPRASKEKLTDALPIIGAFLGLVIAALLVWDGWASVINYNYALVYDDDFSNGLDNFIWEPEIQVGGFGYFIFSPFDHSDPTKETGLTHLLAATGSFSRPQTTRTTYSLTKMASSTSEQHFKTRTR